VVSHVHTRSDETHTFAAQVRAMSGERRKAVRVDYPMERDASFVAVP
jgi:hypothetical protein